MSEIRRFAVRTSGRVLTDVRRPVRVSPAPAVVKAPKSTAIDENDYTKAQLVEMAEARGLDASGNKADLVGRLNG